MDERGESTILITIRARRDPAFPDELFLTARRFGVPEPEPLDEIQSASIEVIVGSVDSWLRAQRGN